MIVFDIETSPLPDDQIRQNIPPFDRESVKTGTRKPDTAKAYIDEQEAKHEAAFFGKAALSPITGHVLAIGCLNVDTCNVKIAGTNDATTEAMILGGFWKLHAKCRNEGTSLVGFNSAQFDLPFLVRRSWLLGVDVPTDLIESGRYKSGGLYIDLMNVWQFGNSKEFISLDRLGRLLGVGGKLESENGEPIKGADFHLLWKEDRATAIKYLTRDLELTAAVATKLGVV